MNNAQILQNLHEHCEAIGLELPEGANIVLRELQNAGFQILETREFVKWKQIYDAVYGVACDAINARGPMA